MVMASLGVQDQMGHREEDSILHPHLGNQIRVLYYWSSIVVVAAITAC